MSSMLTLRAGVFAAALGVAGTAAAVPLTGSVTIGGGAFADTALLDVRTNFSPGMLGSAGLNSPIGVTGNFGGLSFAQTVTFSAFDTNTPSMAPIPSAFTITGRNFTFTAGSVTVVQATPNFADFFFLGNVTTTAAGLEGNTASFRASAARNGNDIGGFSINFGGVLAAPGAAVTVPEPASMALLGLGLLGLGIARRKA